MEIFYMILAVGVVLLIISGILNLCKFKKASTILDYIAAFILCIDAAAIMIMMTIEVAYYLIKK